MIGFPVGIKIPLKVWFLVGGLLAILAMFVVTFQYGKRSERSSWEAKVVRGKAIVEKLKAGQGKITVRTEVRYVDRVKVIKEKANVIIQKIPVYIPADTPDLPGGFRVLHDSAALSTFPGAAEDGLPVSVRHTTETIVRNYSICHQWKAALDEQVSWAKQQRMVYLAECKRLRQPCS